MTGVFFLSAAAKHSERFAPLRSLLDQLCLDQVILTVTTGQVAHTSISVTKQYNLILAKVWWCSVAGNCRPGVILAMLHRRSAISTFQLSFLQQEDDNSTCAKKKHSKFPLTVFNTVSAYVW